MVNWKEFERTREILSHAGPTYSEANGQHHIILRPSSLLRWTELLKEDLEYLTLSEIAGVDKLEFSEKKSYRFELVYHLLNMGNRQRVNLHVRFNEGEIVPSIADFYPHGNWMEEEQGEMLGITFGKPMQSLLLPNDQKIYPLRKDSQVSPWPKISPASLPLVVKNPNKSEAPFKEESYQWRNLNLFDPLVKGLFEASLCLNDNTVVDIRPRIGFNHYGFEKILENKDWLQIMQLVDKVNLGAAPTYSIAWAKALEEILSVKMPERAQAIRIVMLELSRIAEHLTVIFEIIQFSHPEEGKFFLNAREKVFELFEKYCGHRQGFGVAKLGGVRADLPHGWIIEYQNVAEVLGKMILLTHRSLMGHREFRSLQESASVNAQSVLHAGIGGPVMRASGLNFDLRKAQPFYFYQDIDFDVPVGIHGTVFDRYLIRYEEIFQSLRIINQVIDNLPLGEVVDRTFDLDYHELNLYLKNLNVPATWHYTSLESPNGEAGFLLLFDKDLATYRVKIKTPGFLLTQSLSKFMKDTPLPQFRACLASLGLRTSEIDK